MDLLSKCCNIFCCKNRIAEINPPTIRRDNKPVFVNENDENYEIKENEIYLKYIKVNTKKHTYSNYDEFDYNQPLPEIPNQFHQNTIPIIKIKQEIIYNTNLIFLNTEVAEPSPPPLPPKVRRHTKSSILFH